MKFLDYTGLSRLTTNIKSYIASKLQPIVDTTPFYSPALRLDASTGYIKAAVSDSIFDTTNDVWTRIDASATGEKKAMLNRFKSGGFPTVIYVDYNMFRIPFCLISKNTFGATTDVTYRCPFGNFHDIGAKVNQIEIRNVRSTYLLVKQTMDTVEDPQLPFHTSLWSVAANGTVTPSGAQSLTASSTGAALEFFNRIKQGLPPAISVDKTMQDGSKRAVWLYLENLGDESGGILYRSGNFPDPSGGSDRRVQIGMSVGSSSVKATLGLISAAGA